MTKFIRSKTIANQTAITFWDNTLRTPDSKRWTVPVPASVNGNLAQPNAGIAEYGFIRNFGGWTIWVDSVPGVKVGIPMRHATESMADGNFYTEEFMVGDYMFQSTYGWDTNSFFICEVQQISGTIVPFTIYCHTYMYRTGTSGKAFSGNHAPWTAPSGKTYYRSPMENLPFSTTKVPGAGSFVITPFTYTSSTKFNNTFNVSTSDHADSTSSGLTYGATIYFNPSVSGDVERHQIWNFADPAYANSDPFETEERRIGVTEHTFDAVSLYGTTGYGNVGSSTAQINYSAYSSLSSFYAKTKNQYIYTEADLLSMGISIGDDISSFSYLYDGGPVPGVNLPIKIKIGASPKSNFTGSPTFVAGLTEVFNGTQISAHMNTLTKNGLYEPFVFHTLYKWTGGNLVIEISRDSVSDTSGGLDNGVRAYSPISSGGTGSNAGIFSRMLSAKDGASIDTMTTGNIFNFLPLMKLGVAPSTVPETVIHDGTSNLSAISTMSAIAESIKIHNATSSLLSDATISAVAESIKIHVDSASLLSTGILNVSAEVRNLIVLGSSDITANSSMSVVASSKDIRVYGTSSITANSAMSAIASVKETILSGTSSLTAKAVLTSRGVVVKEATSALLGEGNLVIQISDIVTHRGTANIVSTSLVSTDGTVLVGDDRIPEAIHTGILSLISTAVLESLGESQFVNRNLLKLHIEAHISARATETTHTSRMVDDSISSREIVTSTTL